MVADQRLEPAVDDVVGHDKGISVRQAGVTARSATMPPRVERLRVDEPAGLRATSSPTAATAASALVLVLRLAIKVMSIMLTASRMAWCSATMSCWLTR